MGSTAAARDGEGRILRLSPGWDPAVCRLSPAEGFLLSRVDGHTPWVQLRQIGGLPPDEVDRCLERWLDEGILQVPEPGECPQADGSGVPPASEPAGPPPEELLDAGLDLPEDFQRRILTFEASLDRPYHQLLGVDRNADVKVIKRAYFKLSKEFHPDRYYRRKTGDFGQRLERIFKRVVEASELLCDPMTRAEIERSLVHMPPPPPELESEAAAEAETRAQPAPPLSKKRDVLERLRRQFRIPEEILNERRQKARQFSEAARVAIHREQWLEAAASARLAIAFDPWNDEFKKVFAEVQSQVHEVRAAELLERADASWDSHAEQEALRLYEEALTYRPTDPVVNHQAAKLCLALDQLDQATEYAENACDVSPDTAEYHCTLGRILREAGLRVKAVKALERALELDSTSDAATELTALRRSKRRLVGGM